MTNALDISGDVSSAGAALAGLLLVFMGSITTSFESYDRVAQNAVKPKYRNRIWFAFVGFALAILATFLALLAKWLRIECVAASALLILFVSLAWVVIAAIRAALDVK